MWLQLSYVLVTYSNTVINNQSCGLVVDPAKLYIGKGNLLFMVCGLYGNVLISRYYIVYVYQEIYHS